MPVLEEIDEEEWADRYAYLSVLAKSADWATREHATAGLADLDRLAAAGLVKIGAKGYIHGWIKVGPGVAGDVVHHPDHGRGVVSRVGSKTTGVSFENGTYHAFEHTPRTPEHGPAHFVERASTRKPKTPKVEPEPLKPTGTPARSFAEIRARHAEAVTADARAAAKPSRGPADTVAALRGATTREEAHAALGGHSKAELTAAARHGDVAHRAGDTKAVLRDKLVERFTGSRPDSQATRTGIRDRPTEGPEKPARKPTRAAARPGRPFSDVAAYHLDRAHAAIAAGRHADAVDHLTAAANATPDKAAHDRITAARDKLTAKLVPTKPPAPSRPAALKPARPNPAETAARLSDAKSRDEAHALLAGHQKKDLLTLGEHLGMTTLRSSDTKDRMRRSIVEHEPGRRLDSDAIARTGAGTSGRPRPAASARAAKGT